MLLIINMSLKEKKNGIINLVPINASEIKIANINNKFITGKNVEGALEELKDNKTDILNTIGNEAMGTTATTVKGAIAEHGNQINNNTTQLKEMANPNLLINGGPEIWQRGTSFTAFGYTADRWIYDISGDDDGIVTKHADGGLQMKLVSNQRIYLMQRLELTDELKSLLANKTVTISFDVSTSAGVNINPYVRIWHPGNGGHETKKAYNENANEVEKRIQCQLDVGDLSGDDWLGIDIFRIDDTNKLNLSDNLFIRFKNIKLELGSVATPFIPRLYGEELALCKRYYKKFQDYYQIRMSWYTGSSILFPLSPDISMRVKPTIIGTPKVKSITAEQTGFDITSHYDGNTIIATKENHGLTDCFLELGGVGLDSEIY